MIAYEYDNLYWMKIKLPQLSPHYHVYYREHPDTNTVKTTCDAIFNLYQSAAVASVKSL